MYDREKNQRTLRVRNLDHSSLHTLGLNQTYGIGVDFVSTVFSGDNHFLPHNGFS